MNGDRPPETSHLGRAVSTCAARGRGTTLRAVCQALGDLGVPVKKGVFGARMTLELVNDGPVTIVLDV